MRYLIFLVSFLAPVWGFSGHLIEFSDEYLLLDIGNQVGILEDTGNSMSVKDVLESNQFIQIDKNVPNVGVSKSAYWIKYEVLNNSNTEDIAFQLAYPIMDEVSLYSIAQDSSYKLNKMGDNTTFYPRKYNHQNFIFDIHIPKGQSRIFLMKVKSWEQIVLPMNIGTPKSIMESNNIKDILFGLYVGAILIIFFYNLLLYFTVRDKSYLYYVIYILTIASTQAALQAYSYRFFWPSYPWFGNHSIILFPAIAGIATVEFIKNFLKTKEHSPILHKGLYIISITYCFAVISNLLGYQHLSYITTDLNAAFISIYTLVVAITISIKGFRPAKFFLAAWSVFLIGVILFVLKNANILPDNNFTNYTMSLGTILEVSLLSLALADRINELKREKELSQQETLEMSQENERLIRQQNTILEKRVLERTYELNESNLQLNKTLEDLKSTQFKLIESEKMASLGQLTAGIAHEINNPINSVKSNVRPLKRDFHHLNELIEKYEGIKTPEDLSVKLSQIETFKEEIESDYLKEEIVLLLTGIEEGANRTAKIVEGLRYFSRVGDSSRQEYDLTKSIESSLTILQHRLSLEKVSIIRNYEPPIFLNCFPDRINQVFMNILSNAIDALIENKSEKIITVEGKKVNDSVEISISDNGMGMDEKTKQKMFDPFYTTKDVGSGTGLGLSITYGIIKDHSGDIRIESTLGVGTTFTISFPNQ